MDAIPIISVILAPTLVAAFALFQQWRQHEHEKESELRGALGNAALQATRAKWAADTLHNVRKQGVTATDEAWEAAKEFWQARIEGPRHAEDRLAIRVGVESKLHEAYSEVLRRLDEYLRNATRMVEGDARPDDPIATPFLRQSVEEAQALFFEAARERVGLSAERWWVRAYSRIRRR
jgi:hypothetical protein